jgi:hypothetical protein
VFEHSFDAVGEGLILSRHVPQLVSDRQVVDAVGFEPQAICLLAVILNTDQPSSRHVSIEQMTMMVSMMVKVL